VGSNVKMRHSLDFIIPVKRKYLSMFNT